MSGSNHVDKSAASVKMVASNVSVVVLHVGGGDSLLTDVGSEDTNWN